MIARTASLFIDETGDFSPGGDDMRIVGGLLVVSTGSVSTDLREIHDGIARQLAWPARLHARELVEPGLILRWHALGGAAQRAQLQSAEVHALDAVLSRYPKVIAPHLQGRTWAPATKIPRYDPHYGTLRQVGRKLLRRSQAALRTSFQDWCDATRAAFMIAGHVDDKVPGGPEAYDTALQKALELATETALKAGAGHVDVEIAAPIVQGTAEIRALAGRVDRVASVAVVPYDKGSEGLWLADSLLAWCRPLPASSIGSALDAATGVRKCIRAGSSVTLSRPALLETPFDYFCDVVAAQEGVP
jgi:hypothetical protein